jgi:SAM-dependent methyltransferase
MAVSVAEFLLGRRIRTVLDVGCGEAAWFTILRRLRPQIRYTGIDSSDYVIERFGADRNIRRGSLGELARMKIRGDVDLIVCADVLQYVDAREARRGLAAIRRLLGGVAYIEAFTTVDRMEGDRLDWRERSAAEYRRLFDEAGLTQCGPYCFTTLDELYMLNEFEHM